MDEKETTSLVDGAHNLVDRARGNVLSALRKSDFLNLKDNDKTDKRLEGPLNKVNQAMIDLRKLSSSAGPTSAGEELGNFNELLGFFCFACEDWQKNTWTTRSRHGAGLYFQARTC